MRKSKVISHNYELRSVLLTSSLILLTLVGCRSHKEITAGKSLVIDSLAHSEHHRTVAVIDSLVRNIDFSFDTLKINIERPIADAEKPEIIRLTATNGRVIDRRRAQHNQLEVSNQLDTVAYKTSAAETSTEHTATTRLYNPPDGTTVCIITILVIGILLFLRFRKK